MEIGQVQIDPKIDMNWEDGPVAPTAHNYVSVRWTGFIFSNYAEKHQFYLTVNNGADIWINDTIVINSLTAGLEDNTLQVHGF